MTIAVRVAGPYAPDGSPEREYFLASLRYDTQSQQFRDAEQRLNELGCPVFTSDETAEWTGERWIVRPKG